MAKRSQGAFARRKNDLYQTWDERPVRALLPHLVPGTRFVEPCAGEGHLIRQLEAAGNVCVGAIDVAFSHAWDLTVQKGDACTIQADKLPRFDCWITNPPWTRELLHAIIFNLYWQRPAWLLFDADWQYTLQSRPFIPLLRKVVAVGRVKWIPDSKDDGKDNVAWHLFAPAGTTEFVGRQP